MAQPVRRSTLTQFFQWESESWVEVVADLSTEDKVYFMPLDTLKAYFTANDSEILTGIIAELFESEFPPVDPELILRSHTAVFCVLLRIGEGKAIEDFVQFEELSDSRLPFDPKSPPAEFASANDDRTILQRFCEKQWMYCVPIFSRSMLHKRFGPQRLLPITHKEACKTNGPYEKYVVRLYGSHNKLVAPGKNKAKDDSHNNTFVLKRYATKSSKHQYKDEVNGFRSVKQEDSITNFYGSYIQGDFCYVLLQFPDKGSLEDYFQNEAPPSRGVDIVKFWGRMFQLIRGLKTIHSVRGAHQGVKPANVVVISNCATAKSDYEFKFADFGLNHTDIRNGVELQNGKGVQSAKTYDPPEICMRYKDQTETLVTAVSWEADIWSLGCVFSEAAMWIADGHKGLVEYRKQRNFESEMFLLDCGNCFHDGKQVLEIVVEAHRDIEDRLRRSDHITKDVLDSMVDEMLWEEDRPTPSALWRKAEIILQRVRQRSSSNFAAETSRSGSNSSRKFPPLRLQPPTQPLPPVPSVPRGLISGLPSITERGQPASVENWRSQVSEPHSRSHSNGPPPSDISSSSRQHHQLSSPEDEDKEIANSIASWQGDNNSTMSPITPFSSPHVSVNNDFQQFPENAQSEGRPRAVQKQSSYEIRRQKNTLSRGLSYASQHEVIEKSSWTPPLAEHPAYAPQNSNGSTSPTDASWDRRSMFSDQRSTDDTRTIAPPTHNRPGSRHSVAISTSRSSHSDPSRQSVAEDSLPPKSHKRIGGFSLFPNKSRNGEHTNSEIVESPPAYNRSKSRDTTSSYSTSTAAPLTFSDTTSEYLSMTICAEWRKAHKSVKKKSKVPPLPGSGILEPLRERDHCFIIDDSASMTPIWEDVTRVFETLSYVVKGISPSGTELYFTISYDTWRRKDTSDLVTWVSQKRCAGETDISYRLNLELQSYTAKVMKTKAENTNQLRPISYYVLTNGEWGKGVDPRICIADMAELLEQRGMQGQVAIQFINFAENEAASRKIADLAGQEFPVDIADATPITGNVLKMFRGAIDKALFAPIVETMSELQ